MDKFLLFQYQKTYRIRQINASKSKPKILYLNALHSFPYQELIGPIYEARGLALEGTFNLWTEL